MSSFVDPLAGAAGPSCCVLPEQSEQQLHNAGGWDIFLSHSGAQKGFAKGLFEMLNPPYNVFFDVTLPSLPPADDFPPRIHAAKNCRLALVVLSNEFIRSKWPMVELRAFIDAMSTPSGPVKILPLFYELSPEHLKDEEKLQEWHRRWEELASKDARINVSLWAHALKRLRSINGLIFTKSDGELTYLKKIVSAIYDILPPLIKFSHAGIHGADRLCKVFIDKFEDLERRSAQPPSGLSKVSVLGVYGLPGSGKTTLAQCLHDRFFASFAGRTVFLKLPTDPTSTELLKSAKELLKLTDYHNHRQELISKIVDLSQVYSLLKASNLRSSRVFLVIDNISSQDSVRAVEDLLQLGVGVGSRVLLVARTLKILHPLLSFPKNHKGGMIHYVCDSVKVPSMNENEAIRVLMQPGSGLGLAADYNCEMQKECSSRHKEIITKVARMCAFGNQPPHDRHADLLYLPLALKIMGSQLRSNGMDLDKWERQLSRLEAMVKDDVVRNIVEESFQKLQEKLKLLFLDVVLFVVPYCKFHNNQYEARIELLSFMHESSPDKVKREMNDLIRFCFLDLDSSLPDEIIIHDVFLEFAKSVCDASCMYYCSRMNITAVQGRAELCMMVSKCLRALVLEQLDEKCTRFDFPAGLSSVKVVIVRNCKSLAVLGLTGLTSLVSLQVENCPRLRCVKLDPGHTCSLKSVRYCGGDISRHQQQQQQGSFMQSILYWTQELRSAMQVYQLLNMGWCRILQPFTGWPQIRPSNGVISGLASQLKGLQVLRLERTGITSLGDLSSCWPQLRVLEILEDQLEQLELGNLPNLKHFFLGDGNRFSFLELNKVTFYDEKSKPRMPRRPNLLAGCPELENVRICKPACEDGMSTLTLSPNLRTLWLKHIHYGEPVLPDFTSLAHSLEEIVVWDHWVLESLEFTCQFLGLVNVSLWGCHNLVRITGLEFLPNLRDLHVVRCDNLQALGNLEANLGNLVYLETLKVFRCPKGQFKFLISDLENLTALRQIMVDWGHFVWNTSFKLNNLVNLESLWLQGDQMQLGAASQYWSLCCYEEAANCQQQVNSSALHIKNVPLFLIGESGAPPHLSRLALGGVQNLVCLDGIHCLLTLKVLYLHHLPGLTCLRGVESLIHLRMLHIAHCNAVEELPSLCTLVNMQRLSIMNCLNLKSLEGFDKMTSLKYANLNGCKNLERLELFSLATLINATLKLHNIDPDYNSADDLHYIDLERPLGFRGCKFASVKAMVEWVLDEEVSKVVVRASVDALVWEFTDHLLEKPIERMELGVLLVETLAVYLLRKLPLNDEDHFDFRYLGMYVYEKLPINDEDHFGSQTWADDLERLWRCLNDGHYLDYQIGFDEACRRHPRKTERKSTTIPFPSVFVELMRGLAEVPLRGVLQQCQSDAQFRLCVANCLLETDPLLLAAWISCFFPTNNSLTRERGTTTILAASEFWCHCL